jgi:hypothetical protein
VQIYGDQLRIFVQDGDAILDQITGALAAQEIEVLDARLTRPRMEEAFISLIRRRRGENETSAPEGELVA